MKRAAALAVGWLVALTLLAGFTVAGWFPVLLYVLAVTG